jgi:hypothetical protein
MFVKDMHVLKPRSRMGWMVISTSSATMERARIGPSWLHNGSVLFIMTTVRLSDASMRFAQQRFAPLRFASFSFARLRSAPLRCSVAAFEVPAGALIAILRKILGQNAFSGAAHLQWAAP